MFGETMMVDPLQRRRYARLLRALATGRLTNFEFEDAVEKSVDLRKDNAVDAINDVVWCLYDEMQEHRLRGLWALDPKMKRTVATWLLFLYGDLEFSKSSMKELEERPFPNKEKLEETASRAPRFYCGEESLHSGIAPFRTGRLRDDENMESFRHRFVPASIGALTVSFFIWRQNEYSSKLFLPLSAFALAITVLYSASFSYKPLDSIKISIWQFLLGIVLIIGAAVLLAIYVF